MRTFVFTDDKSNKFWNIEFQGKSFTVTYGKVGSEGQTQTKKFPDERKARAAQDKLIAEKLAKGYVETTPTQSTPSALPSVGQLLEKAVVQNPDDLATQCAFADYLMEQGDPRGEFIQVQLALEDPDRPAKERTQLRKRETELLKEHGRKWLGEAGRFLFGDWSGEDKPYQYRFTRGWLDFIRMLPNPDAVIAAVARSPEVSLLRRLEVVYDMRYHPFNYKQFTQGPIAALGEDEGHSDYMGDEANIMPVLLESPYLTNLRVFKLGFSDTDEQLAHSTMIMTFESCNAQQVIELLQKCPHLSELYLNTVLIGIDQLFGLPKLGNIRVLQYYYGEAYGRAYGRTDGSIAYPLRVLANNPSLQQLTTLRLHPGREATIELEEMDAVLRSPHLPRLTHLQVHMTTFGDEGARRIVESGILRRLKVLDIGYGNMTDEGAQILADCPDLKNLELLNVTQNALTDQGLKALRRAGMIQPSLFDTPEEAQEINARRRVKIQVISDHQHAPDEDEYLYGVDME